MTMPQWAPLVLAAQLVLTFFMPAFSVGARSVFISDLWCMGWVAAALWAGRKEIKRLLPFFLVTGAVLAITYVHGYFRPSVMNIEGSQWLLLTEPDGFSAARELVIATRFLSWIWGGAIVYSWFSGGGQRARRSFQFLCGVLSACLLTELALLVASKASPELDQALSRIYGFKIGVTQWWSRAHGTFRSPLETGTAMAFGGLLLALRAPVRSRWFWDGGIAAVGGIWLTRTGTAAVGFAAVALMMGIVRLKSPWRWVLPLCALLVIAIAFPILTSRPGVVENKWANFLSRFRPWRIYFDVMCQRLDHLFLGFGFAPYHTDNSYVFIFNRGGLIALGAFLWFSAKGVAAKWASWAWSERGLIIYLAVSALTLDILIYRPIAALLLAVGIPALAGRFKLA